MAEKPYRIEAAMSGRSTCSVSKAKIEKGELRIGAWVKFGSKGSYKWRRLSCITPKQALNIEKEVGGPECLDGFAELTAEQRAVVLGAFSAAVSGAGPTAESKKGEGLPAAKRAKLGPCPEAEADLDKEALVNVGSAPSGTASAGPWTPDVIAEAHRAIDLAKAGDWAAVYKVLDARKNLVNVRPEVREYAVLHQAAFHGSADAVATLLTKYGADPAQRTKFGKSPMDVAKEQGHAGVVEYLVPRLAEQWPKGEGAAGPLDLTPEKVAKEAKPVMPTGSGASQSTKLDPCSASAPAQTETPAIAHTAHRAIDLAKNGQWDDLFTLLDFRRDVVNVRPEVREYGILHQAAFHGNVDAVDALLKTYGADPAQRTRSGKTASEVALEEGHIAMADVLQERLACAPARGGEELPARPACGAEEEDNSGVDLVQMPDGSWKVQAAKKGLDGQAAPGSSVPNSVGSATGAATSSRADGSPSLACAAATPPTGEAPAAGAVPPPALPPEIVDAAHQAIDLAKAASWAELYRLLDSRPGLVNIRPDVREFSVLHQAAYHGNKEAAVTLITKYGADPAQRTKVGASAAVVAAGQGHPQVAASIWAYLPE